MKEGSTVDGNIAKPSSTYESSIKKRSMYLEETQEQGGPLPGSDTEKALEETTPKYDESKILHGQRLFFAFAAMMLSVLLIALGRLFFLFNLGQERENSLKLQTRQLLPLLCEEAHLCMSPNHWLI